MIENEIFKRCKVNIDKLISYGFIKEQNKYVFSKKILDDTFNVIVEVENDIVTGKIYDLSFNEEYTNYRIENQTGEFVNNIRKQFEDILIDIKNKCFKENYFVSNQANRITDFIINNYNDKPIFPWENSLTDAVFKNPINGKWYGLIMKIKKNKIDKGNGEVEILNVKLDSKKVENLVNKKGFYKAYHMNKKYWITIILDDTVSDEEIIECIRESHAYTEITDEWIIPANPKYYDVINCFNDTDTINWKQSNNIKVNDIVYLYVASPISAILYKCKVIEINIPYQYRDENLSMSKVMKIKLLKKYDQDKYTFDVLNKFGIKSIRGPRRIPEKFKEEIDKEN